MALKSRFRALNLVNLLETLAQIKSARIPTEFCKTKRVARDSPKGSGMFGGTIEAKPI